MFEQILVSSAKSVVSGRMRSIAVASVGLQCLVVAAFVVVPLIWPEALPLVSVAPKMTVISMRRPPVKVTPRVVPVVMTNASLVHAPSQVTAQVPRVEALGGGMISHGSPVAFAAEVPSLYTGGGMSTTPSLGTGVGVGPDSGPAVVAGAPAMRAGGPVRVSSGVSSGMLLAPIQPRYPQIAVMARVQGTVVVTATIDKQGRITGLQVVSGPEMLRKAAADAIAEARYRPYLLNGEATDVVTTISVTFRVGA